MARPPGSPYGAHPGVPTPPPMAPSLPWLVVSYDIDRCYSLSDQTLLRLRLRLPSSLPPHDLVASSHGWLLLLHGNTSPGSQRTPSLLNPITGHHILLPPLVAADPFSHHRGAISAPPSDPRCAVLVTVNDNIFLYRRVADCKRWIRLDFPQLTNCANYYLVLQSAGKFYCASESLNLYVIHPLLPLPWIQRLEMDASQLLPYDETDVFCFQELNSEISVLVRSSSPDYGFEGFHLFKADLLTNVWVKMEGIGDRVLFATDRSPFSFSLSSPDMGCNNNCVYFLQSGYLRYLIWRLGALFLISRFQIQLLNNSFCGWTVIICSGSCQASKLTTASGSFMGSLGS